MVRVFLCLLGFLLITPAMALSQATATVDRNPARVNESLVLTVEVNDSVDANALDTSPLLKDFIVQRTSVSSQTSMVNFKTTRTTRFQTVLIPKRAGSLIVPPLTVEGLSTSPITLTVLAKNEQANQGPKEIFITSDISSKELYVQQQITLTVKLHFSAELRRGSMSEPSLINANINQIGQDKESQDIINGQRYRIIERTYGITPQQSGEFILQSPVFSGEIMVPSARRSNFLSYNDTKPVSIIGDEINITVKPIPDNYQGDWLPSEILTLHQEWQPDVNTFTVGEPITRTLTLTAAGLSEEQLPALTMAVPEGIKVYPDQAELHTGINSERLVSQQVRGFALVAGQAGEFELPEVTIPWWNTVTNSYQVATIPAQKITVLPNPELENQNLANAANSSNTGSGNGEQVVVTVTKASNLQWLFLALWLLTSFAWLTTALLARRHKAGDSAEKKNTGKIKPVGKINDAYLALLAACKKNQGQQILSLLVPWINSLKLQAQAVGTLDEALALVNNNQLNNAVVELQQSYFGKGEQNWQSNSLITAVQQINKKPKASKKAASFSLNP